MAMNISCIFILFYITLVSGQNFYDSDPRIIELSPSNFDKVIHRTNYTSVVEFYAPWCGYCKQLKPVIHKAAKKLDGVVQVAAVNCDLEKNKQLCAQHNVEGFPTVMVFRPPKLKLNGKTTAKFQYHASEKYNGERKLAPIVEFAYSRIKNYLKKLVRVDNLSKVLDNSDRPAVILFSKQDKVSPIFKSINLDWLGTFNFYSFYNKKLSLSQEGSQFMTKYPNIASRINEIVETQKNSDKSKLVVLDGVNDKIYELEEDSINKPQVSEFLSKTFLVTPKEGPLSKRQDYLESLKLGKKNSRKFPKSKPASKKKLSNKKVENDEL